VYEVAVSSGAMKIQRPIPLIYPVEVYVVEVSVGALRLRLEKPLLVYRGNASGLAKGLDFAELGLTSLVSITAVDSTGSPRRDWAVQLIYGNVTVAEGRGTLTAVLLRTSVLGQPYVAKVVTTALTPEGSVAVREQQVLAEGDRREVWVVVPTARVAVLAVDGFGRPRDWPVEVVGVAVGRGAVGVEVLPGRYTVKVTAFGKEYAQAVEVQPGQNQTVTMQVPTAVLNIVVLDDDRRPIDRYVTSVVVTGPVAVELSTPPRGLEVPPGEYTIRVTALGRESPPVAVEVGPGEEKTVEVVVPGTAGYDQLPARPTSAVVQYAAAFLALIAAVIILVVRRATRPRSSHS